ncbi:MAG: chemotaxis protein [Hydrocarboniphaga sp.]|uniref:methyl-accepting chemotaxis protein n=1 Tax=Hydrocarboniphaga sp. TaxID=2033016 RepID=UPI002632BC15|nr:methyl-accepting chemotaxis protein [Hydrocarboniphaga sp.]MDB5971254.1 chemotaxis protein [Hydrocarboniphaga sp.]
MRAALALLLAPSTRLMGRLRFAQKIALIGAIFLIAILGLSLVLVAQVNGRISSTRSEQLGVSGLVPLLDLLQTLQVHRGLSDRIGAGEEGLDAQLAPAASKVEAAFAALSEWSDSSGQILDLSGMVSGLHEQWSGLSDGGVKLGAAAPKAYGAVAEGLYQLAQAIADRSQLTLDPVLESYNLMDAAVFRLPLIALESARLRDVGNNVISAGVMYTGDRSTLTSLGFLVDREAGLMARNLKAIIASQPRLQESLAEPLAAAVAATASLQSAVHTGLLEAKSIEMPVADYQRTGNAAVDASLGLIDAATAALDVLLQERVAGLRFKLLFTVAAVVAVMLLAGYLFAGFTRSLGESLRGIGDAVRDMSQGRFPEAVSVTTRDEIGEVAKGIHAVVVTLRSFAAAQQQIYSRHHAGEISYRIADGEFQGGYGEMAANVNRLAEAHIGTTDTVVSLIQRYALGDLAPQMERLPGEMERISDAMGGIRERLTAVRDEILGLSEAAARGEFTRRGDAGRFEFAFREMVEALNALMSNAENGLSGLGKLLHAVARGDLTPRMQGEFHGQFASLRDDANSTVEQLSGIVEKIQSSSAAIETSVREIASGNQDLSSRTEQQAAALQETASSMEELTSTVKQNAENARVANQFAIGAGRVAVKGGEVVSQVVGTMSEISASSKRIADIVGVIDGIAFQTNILALNAAVEAARAGEQGRGFAVVATEVRSLAQRSAASAREIKTLIQESANRVQAGSRLVEEAGTTMNEIVDSVKRVTDIMADITLASQEQSSGIEQVNRTITHMDESTQQNAALVEEAAASAHNMEEMAQALGAMIRQFKLSSAAEHEPAAPSQRRSTAPVRLAIHRGRAA